MLAAPAHHTATVLHRPRPTCPKRTSLLCHLRLPSRASSICVRTYKRPNTRLLHGKFDHYRFLAPHLRYGLVNFHVYYTRISRLQRNVFAKTLNWLCLDMNIDISQRHGRTPPPSQASFPRMYNYAKNDKNMIVPHLL